MEVSRMRNSASSSTSQQLSNQIQPEHKAQAEKIVSQVQEIIGRISAIMPSELAQGLTVQQDLKSDELFTKSQLQ